MRHTYIRFVVSMIDEDSGRRRGVFQAIADLIDAKALSPPELEEVLPIRRWFDKHLAEPNRFSRSQRKNEVPRGISWYKSSATDYISRMHTMCRILNQHGIATTMITSPKPGYVVFEDEHQVVALPFTETIT